MPKETYSVLAYLAPKGALFVVLALVDSLEGHLHELEHLRLLLVPALIHPFKLQLMTNANIINRYALPPLHPTCTPQYTWSIDARSSALLARCDQALMLTHVRAPALLASPPFPLVGTDARTPAFLAIALSALVLAQIRPPALLAIALSALVWADARPPALLTLALSALVRADARPPALLALAPEAEVLADTRPPTFLASALSAPVLAETVDLLLRHPTATDGDGRGALAPHCTCIRVHFAKYTCPRRQRLCSWGVARVAASGCWALASDLCSATPVLGSTVRLQAHAQLRGSL